MAFDSWQVFIITGTVLFNIALLPQLVRTLQLRRADDISVAFTLLILVASVSNMTYFLHLREWIAAFGFVGNLIVWSIVLYFRLHPSPEKARPPRHGRQPNG